MRVRLATAITVVAVLFSASAQAENYGTSPSQAAQMKQMIYDTFGTDYVGQCFIRIAARESGFNPRAANWRDRHANGRGSFGLFQIGRIHVGMVGGDWRRLLDPATNVRVAKRLFDANSFGPWGGCPG